jgi:hypothetical protein
MSGSDELRNLGLYQTKNWVSSNAAADTAPGPAGRPFSAAETQQLLASGRYTPNLCVVAAVHNPPAPRGYYLQLIADEPVDIPFDASASYGSEFHQTGFGASYVIENYSAYHSMTVQPAAGYNAPVGGAQATTTVKGVRNTYLQLLTNGGPVNELRYCAYYLIRRYVQNGKGTAVEWAEIEKRRFAEEARQQLAVAVPDALAAGGWSSLDQYLSHTQEFHVCRNIRKSIDPYTTGAREEYEEKCLDSEAFTRGMKTSGAAENSMEKILQLYPQATKEKLFNLLAKVVDAGPGDASSDQLKERSARGGAIEELDWAVTHAAANGTITDWGALSPPPIGPGQLYRCLDYDPGLWPEVEQDIKANLKTNVYWKPSQMGG